MLEVYTALSFVRDFYGEEFASIRLRMINFSVKNTYCNVGRSLIQRLIVPYIFLKQKTYCNLPQLY